MQSIFILKIFFIKFVFFQVSVRFTIRLINNSAFYKRLVSITDSEDFYPKQKVLITYKPMFTATSHFIGIWLNTEKLLQAFLSVNEYFSKKEGISYYSMNPHSTHITLYYLPKNLDQDYLEKISKKIEDYIILSDLNIHIQGIHYFMPDKRNSILYLEPTYQKFIIDSRDDFIQVKNFDIIIDNQYNYVPHITLWKLHSTYDISNDSMIKICYELYEIIKPLITQDNLAETLWIFRVNSSILPELQFPIISKKFSDKRTT